MFTLQAIDKVECLTQSLEPIKFEDMGLLGWFCWGGWGQDMGSNSSFDKHPQDQCSVVVVGAKTWEVTVHLTKKTGPPHPWCGNRHARRGVQRRQGGEPEDPIKQQHPKC